MSARSVIEEMVRDPYSFKQLGGKYKEVRSARFGDHRIIYVIREEHKEIVLLAVEPRSGAYER